MGRARLNQNRGFYVEAGRKIRDTRMRQLMTQEALASKVSLTRTSIVNIEKGKQQLLLHTLVELARALKIQPSELIPDTGQQESSDLNVLLRDTPNKKGRDWIKSAVESVREEA